MNASSVSLFSPPIDAGDVSHPDDSEGFQRSVDAFRALSDYAESRNVRIMIENFHALASHPETLNASLDQLDSWVRYCADFGDHGIATKCDDLVAILPRADSINSKADFDADGEMDRENLSRCLNLAVDAPFD